jgi:hypothetical protein
MSLCWAVEATWDMPRTTGRTCGLHMGSRGDADVESRPGGVARRKASMSRRHSPRPRVPDDAVSASRAHGGPPAAVQHAGGHRRHVRKRLTGLG